MRVGRNRKNEDDLKNAKTDKERDKCINTPGVVVNAAKQRNGDFEGRVGLWFDQETYRYRATAERPLNDRKYVSDVREIEVA